jgi:alpha-D-ribose 1-methylphosphonate 5-triphosphate diphosphatase PhnM
MMSPRAKSGGKSHRPSTSGVGSRKMSISKRDRDVDSKGYTIDIQNYFDKENGKKTNQSESKFVSINQLMKHNNQGASRLNQTLHYKGSEDELNDEQYQTLQTFQGGRSTTQLQTYKPGYNNFDERTKNLKYFKDGQQLNLKSEDDLIKGRLRNIQPTDDRTMNKILNFA